MRKALAWALFFAGALVARVMRYWDRLGLFSLYPAYNRLMRWSSAAQGGGKGPWDRLA